MRWEPPTRCALTITWTVSIVALSACGATTGATAHRTRLSGTTHSARSSRPSDDPASIAAFGHRADRHERTAIAAALDGYLSGVAAQNGALACSYLATAFRSEVVAAAQASSRTGRGDCAKALASSIAAQPRQTRTALRRVVIIAVRVKGASAFAIVRQPQTPVSFYPLVLTHGTWKVNALSSTVMPT